MSKNAVQRVKACCIAICVFVWNQKSISYESFNSRTVYFLRNIIKTDVILYDRFFFRRRRRSLWLLLFVCLFVFCTVRFGIVVCVLCLCLALCHESVVYILGAYFDGTHKINPPKRLNALPHRQKSSLYHLYYPVTLITV